jgi:hypothetical protein
MTKLLPIVAITAAAFCSTATAATPHAHIAKNCSLSTAEQGGSNPSTLGPTYVIKDKFTVSGLSCGKGKKLIHGYGHSSKNGSSKPVKGFHCSQKIEESSSTEYTASVTCKKGSATEKHVYVEFT